MTGDADDDERIINQRGDLLQQVRIGELTPEQAEEEASRLECGPLASTPDHDAFEPMREPTWTLPMAIAWIAWRTPEKVREWWDTYVEHCWDWRRELWTYGRGQPDYEGYVLKRRRAGTVVEMLLCDHLADETEPTAISVVPLAEARGQLWAALRRGAVMATAVDGHSEEHTRIPPSEWEHLKPTTENGRDVLMDRDVFPSRSCYQNVLLEAVAIRRIWSARVELPEMPPPMRSPAEGGYIPLFCAAQWIATQGASTDVDWSPDPWRVAYSQLFARIYSGEVEVIGTQNDATERIEGYQLAGIRIVYPFECHSFLGVPAGGPATLVSCPDLGQPDWSSGAGDSICNQDGPVWSTIMVRAEHIARHWAFDQPFAGHNPLTHSGFAGRPTTKHLVQAEFTRRCENGLASRKLAREAEQLLDWLTAHHRDVPAPTVKTIRNNIRDQHRAYRMAQEGPK
ncbi:hypothetical protein [Acuticoccus kandeliae]|uniref:hypothetical protein n=1 Tax=Acuticoccus kandeliae TaxID=2073160 RepID=UPI0013007B3B|nr:hypothetical protein [Acuticoccus kandeliae]